VPPVILTCAWTPTGHRSRRRTTATRSHRKIAGNDADTRQRGFSPIASAHAGGHARPSVACAPVARTPDRPRRWARNITVSLRLLRAAAVVGAILVIVFEIWLLQVADASAVPRSGYIRTIVSASAIS